MLYQGVMGQDYALTILKNSLFKGRLPGSYLFYGPPGVGKNKTAKLLAKRLCCLNQKDLPDIDACNECPSCKRIEQGLHPDVKEILPEGNFLKIEQIRSLQSLLQFRPYEADKKIFLIDQAEKMRQEAANCFLKTLEEPPGYAIFILIVNNLNALLPTIISRCQLVRFNLLPNQLSLEIIKGWQIETDKARRLAFWTQGSPGKAKEYLEANIFELEEKFLDWINKLQQGSLIHTFKIAERVKEEPDIFLDVLSFWLREGLWQIAPSPLSKLEIKSFLAATEMISQARNQLIKQANVQLTLEVLLIRLKRLLWANP